jgi:hypothetical protein
LKREKIGYNIALSQGRCGVNSVTAAVFVIRFSDVKPIWYGTVHLRFQPIKKNSLRCSIQNLSKVADPGHKAEEFSMK